MKRAAVEDVPVAAIEVGARLRRVDQRWVAVLAETIKVQGLIQPIEVVATGEVDSEFRASSFRLIAGAHRLAAIRSLGRQTITALVQDAAWLKAGEARLREILENVARHELTKLDRAAHLAELHDLSQTLYPKRRRGGDRKSQAFEEERQNQTTFFAVVESAAEAVGLGERAFFLAVSLWKGLGDGIADRIRDGHERLADHQAHLVLLSEQDDDRQRLILDLMTETGATVPEAIERLDQKPKRPKDEKVQRFSQRFSRLSPLEQRRFFDLHSAAIDRWLAERRRRS